MRIWALIVFLLFSGCTGLKTKCDNMDEEKLGQSYAVHNTDTRNFDIWANQCAKYGYHVPSKEKFLAAYNKAVDAHCATSREYFITAYVAYRKNGYPLTCSDSSAIGSAAEEVRRDAFKASLYKGTIDDSKKDSHNTSNYKPHDLAEAALVGVVLAPISILNAYDAEKSAEKLRALATKYGYMESELQ